MELDKNHAYFREDDPDRIDELDALRLEKHEVGPFSVLALHDEVIRRLRATSTSRYCGDWSGETLRRMGTLQDMQRKIDDYITEHLQVQTELVPKDS